MATQYRRQSDNQHTPIHKMVGVEGIIPNPKLKLLDQVREVLRLRHYSIRTELSYCDWIERRLRVEG